MAWAKHLDGPGYDGIDWIHMRQNNGPGHLGQQAVRAQQLHALGLRLAQQLVRQLLVDQRRPSRVPVARITSHHRSVSHRVSFREPPFLRLIVRPRHLHSWEDTPRA